MVKNLFNRAWKETWAVLFLLAFVTCLALADMVIRLLPGDDYYE
jgi:hypothetical protein